MDLEDVDQKIIEIKKDWRYRVIWSLKILGVILFPSGIFLAIFNQSIYNFTNIEFFSISYNYPLIYLAFIGLAMYAIFGVIEVKLFPEIQYPHMLKLLSNMKEIEENDEN